MLAEFLKGNKHMIPAQMYPELGELFKGVPQLFKHSEIIGVFLGEEICASFLHSAEHLDKIVFYENFIAIPDAADQENLKQLYKTWENTVPNLEVLLVDGINFDITADYVHHDMHMSRVEFFTLFKDKLQNSLMSNPGFGRGVPATLQIAKCIDNKLIFPVLVYRDILFYTFNKEKKHEVFEIIHSFLLSSKLVFSVNIDYVYTNDTILKLHNIGSYNDRLNEAF